MRLEKFTLRGQEAIQAGIELAERNQNQQVEPEHILCAMLDQPEGIVRPLLGKLALQKGMVSPTQLKECLAEQAALGCAWALDASGATYAHRLRPGPDSPRVRRTAHIQDRHHAIEPGLITVCSRLTP